MLREAVSKGGVVSGLGTETVHLALYEPQLPQASPQDGHGATKAIRSNASPYLTTQ